MQRRRMAEIDREGRRGAPEADRRRDDGLQAGARGVRRRHGGREGLAPQEGPVGRGEARGPGRGPGCGRRGGRRDRRRGRRGQLRDRLRRQGRGVQGRRGGARGAGRPRRRSRPGRPTLRGFDGRRDHHPDGFQARRAHRARAGRRATRTDGVLDGYKHVQNDRGTIGVLVELGGVDPASARGPARSHTTSRCTSRARRRGSSARTMFPPTRSRRSGRCSPSSPATRASRRTRSRRSSPVASTGSTRTTACSSRDSSGTRRPRSPSSSRAWAPAPWSDASYASRSARTESSWPGAGSAGWS